MATTIQEQKFELNQLSEKRLASSYPQDMVIVSEGDSWFDYPLRKDVIDHLVSKGYAIKNYAKHGDTLENMIYGSGYELDGSKIHHFGPTSLQTTLMAIKNLKPKFFLFSGGGNDIVGSNMIHYLNHKLSMQDSLLNKKIFHAKLENIRKALSFLIESMQRSNPECHMIMDGYDYAKVTGKGYSFIGIRLAGPWLLPSMAAKAITETNKQIEIVKQLIDGFNEVLAYLERKYSNFHFIDLRGQFPHVNSWDNEIHLRSKGYEKVADIYHNRMCDILKYDPTHKYKGRIFA